MAARAQSLKNFVMRALLNPWRSKQKVKPLGRWNVVVGDTVQVNTGRDRGKSGKVKKVLRSKNRVVIEGLNLKRKHVRPSEGRAGGVISIEAPIHYSNVNLVDATSGKRTRVVRRWTQAGERVRIAKAGGGVIPIPQESRGGAAARDPARIRGVEPGPADTPAAAVSRRTYTPPQHLAPFLSRGSSPLFTLRPPSPVAEREQRLV